MVIKKPGIYIKGFRSGFGFGDLENISSYPNHGNDVFEFFVSRMQRQMEFSNRLLGENETEAVDRTAIQRRNTGAGRGAIAGIRSKDFKIPDDIGHKLVKKIEHLWRAEAKSVLTGTALYDYIRAMKVEFVNQSIRMTLDGWEAVSREVGWAPKPGGLAEGLGAYDGTLHDMKPMLLAGASRKVIPMRLEGTKEDILSRLSRDAELNRMVPPKARGLDPFDVRRAKHTKKKIEAQVEGAFATPLGKRVDFAKRDKFVAGEGEPILRNLRRKYTKSLLETSKVMKSPNVLTTQWDDMFGVVPKLKKLGTTTFIVFRTVTDGTLNVEEPVRGRGKRTTKKYKRAQARSKEMRKKWLSKGRAPIKLLDKMQKIAYDEIMRVALILATRASKSISDV